MMLNNLFNSNGEVVSRGRQLDNTAQLTRIATDVTREVMKRIEAGTTVTEDASDEAKAEAQMLVNKVTESQESHDIMDDLISELYLLESVDVEFLKGLGEEELDKMIKSQQSKRSRAKSKEMTLENYITMMTGAVAENLLRIAGDKPKSSGGGGARKTDVTYTDEELQRFVDDPESLKKAIRNVQSKKSIEKRKSDFSEESDRWKEILDAEAQLIAIRDGMSAEAEKAIDTNNQIEDMLAEIDTKDMKAAEAKEMLENIKQMLASK